jgi:hypothetical protein
MFWFIVRKEHVFGFPLDLYLSFLPNFVGGLLQVEPLSKASDSTDAGEQTSYSLPLPGL